MTESLIILSDFFLQEAVTFFSLSCGSCSYEYFVVNKTLFRLFYFFSTYMRFWYQKQKKKKQKTNILLINLRGF